MAEQREIQEHARQPLQGPHFPCPDDFVPLYLSTEPEQVRIAVDCPQVIVGRQQGARLRLAFPDVSRRHCRIAFEDGQWRIYDLQSLNGLYLNGKLVTEATLYAGDRLRIGSVNLLVESSTPIRLLEDMATEDQQDKLRQIVQSLPAN